MFDLGLPYSITYFPLTENFWPTEIYGGNDLSTLFMKPVAEHSSRSQDDIWLLFPEIGTGSCSAVNHAEHWKSMCSGLYHGKPTQFGSKWKFGKTISPQKPPSSTRSVLLYMNKYGEKYSIFNLLYPFLPKISSYILQQYPFKQICLLWNCSLCKLFSTFHYVFYFTICL